MYLFNYKAIVYVRVLCEKFGVLYFVCTICKKKQTEHKRERLYQLNAHERRHIQGPAEIPDDSSTELWRGELVLERPSSETQSISVALELWSVEHRAFAVEMHF